MTTLSQLEEDITGIKARNVRVEEEKAWETSKTRKILLMLFTYLAIGCYLQSVHVDSPWINAIVPTIGFLLSTLTMPFFKELWKEHIYHKAKKLK